MEEVESSKRKRKKHGYVCSACKRPLKGPYCDQDHNGHNRSPRRRRIIGGKRGRNSGTVNKAKSK